MTTPCMPPHRVARFTWLLHIERLAFVLEKWLCIAALTVMLLAITASVLVRNFNLPMPNPGEWGLVAMAPLTFVGAALCAYTGTHIAVDIIGLVKAPALRHLARWLVALAMLVFATVYVWAGAIYFQEALITGERLLDMGDPAVLFTFGYGARLAAYAGRTGVDHHRPRQPCQRNRGSSMSLALFLLALLVLGVPIAVVFTLIVIVKREAWNIDWSVFPALVHDTISSFPLLAIPLFLLAGEVMNRGGLIRQLTAVCDMLLGWVKAPMGHIMVAASGLMGAITGSSVATVAAIGGTVGREMLGRGYPPGYVGALNAATGLMGVLIPPSIPLILYGSIVGVSITQLFLASTVPGLFMMLCFMAAHRLMGPRLLPDGKEVRPAPSALRATPQRRARQWLLALPALFLPILVLGGIYSGRFTPTEAAAIAGVYALFVTLTSRALKPGELPQVFLKASLSAAAILVIIGFTSLFNRAMVLEQIPQGIAALAMNFTESPLLFLLMVNALLLVVGMFMETNAATLLMGPLLAPAAIRYGIDPIHFAIVLVTNIEIGLLTPPLAANVYVAARTNKIPLLSMFRHLAGFFGVCLVVLAIITYVPALSLWYRYI